MRENEGRQATQDWCVGECWEIGETLPGRDFVRLFWRGSFFWNFLPFLGFIYQFFFNINEIIDNIFLLFSLFCGFSEHFVFLRNLRAINIDFLFQTRFAGFQPSINFLVHIFLVIGIFWVFSALLL